jgi:hypothetical protein
MNFEMINDAKVEIETGYTEKNFPVAIATINDTYQHHFDASSRVSKSLDIMTSNDLADRLTGGHFFMQDGQLIDFRDGQYNGFVHGDDSIQKLIEVIGYTEKKNRNNTTSNNIALSSVWSNNDIEVPLYASGGDFQSRLSFSWNPFMKDVHSTFELVRLICTNGMTGLTSFLNTKIPLVNRWEEHLEIASRQIQNKVSSKVVARLGEMGNERATVSECQSIVTHADDRLKNGNVGQASRERLKNIAMVASPTLHLGKVYKGNVFDDRRLGAQLPSHLSTYDIYNMATEINTHTDETNGSSSFAMDKIANALIFDREDLTKHSARFGQPTLSAFSDAEAAFFGAVN